MRVVDTAPHEFTANFLYDEHGLDPWFALDAAVKDGGGSMAGEFTSNGEKWVAKVSYRDSNIVYPGEETPAGTSWDFAPDTDTEVDTIRREYQLKVARHVEEDMVGDQDFSVNISPRWQGMEGLKDDGTTTDISVPDNFGEGINLKITGSNIEFERYEELIQYGMDACFVSAQYFETLHENSNILDAERYVRIHREESGPIHARDGPLARLAHVLENDRSGYRKIVQNDDDERGRNVPGYYHTTTLGPNRIQEAWPHHELPKEIKHYYAREAVAMDESDPLAHPKLGASYQTSRHGSTVPVEKLDTLSDELEETVHSVLMAAGINVSPVEGSGPFFEDAYFTPTTHEREGQPVSLNITNIKKNQESVVVRQLSDGLSPVQWDSITQLVTDGGEVSPADIAEENDRHVGSVRRALRDMEDMVDRKYGEVALKSEYIAEMVHEAVKDAREATQNAVETAAKTMEAADKGLSQSMAEWVAWCERHGVDISNRANALEIDVGSVDDVIKGSGIGGIAPVSVKVKIEKALALWSEAGQDPERFKTATVRYVDGRDVERTIRAGRLI